MPNTPKGLTYPSSSSPVAVPADIQELATDVDGLIVPNTGGTYTGSVSFTQPPSVPTPTSGLHAVNKTYADAINADVTALETELGTNPSGTFSTVKDRLDSYTTGFNTVGNLLTANQASGGDTLGDTTGFSAFGHATIARSTGAARAGTGSIRVAQTDHTWFQAGIPLTAMLPLLVGKTVTFCVSVRSDAATTTVVSAPYLATNLGNIQPLRNTSINQSGWTDIQGTWAVPAAGLTTLEFKTSFEDASGAGAAYIDCFGMWYGAGGKFALPGTPVVGQSRIAVNNAVDLSGTGTPEGVITAAPGSTWLQTDSTTDVKGWIKWVKATGTGNTGWIAGPEADTGWRNVAASASGLTGTDINARMRRVGANVQWAINYAATAANAGVSVMSTSGFLPAAPTRYLPCYSNAAGVDGVIEVSATGIKVYQTAAAIGGAWSTDASWLTADAWPASLPGSAA